MLALPKFAYTPIETEKKNTGCACVLLPIRGSGRCTCALASSTLHVTLALGTKSRVYLLNSEFSLFEPLFLMTPVRAIHCFIQFGYLRRIRLPS